MISNIYFDIEYLFFVVTADFAGTGGSPAFSNTMELELSNGGSTIYKEGDFANSGTMNNSNATTLKWSGMMLLPYTGGNLTARFYDEYTDGSGPYTSNMTNVSIKIYKVAVCNTLPTINPGRTGKASE